MKNHCRPAVLPAAVFACIITAVTILAFAAALAAVFLRVFSSPSGSPFFTPDVIFRTAAYTFRTAFLSALTAAAIGIPAAFFTARRNFFGRRFLLALSAVPLCVPPLIIALGFVSTFGMNGSLNTAAVKLFHMSEPPFTFLYSAAGVIIAQGFYNFPLVTAVVSDSWSRLPQQEAEEARMLGANERHIFFSITLRQLSPAIAAACIPVFLYCFFSFMIVMLFGNTGGATFETQIYQASRIMIDFRSASLLAIIETACAVLPVFVYSRLILNTDRDKGIQFSGTENIRIKIGHPLYKNKAASVLEYSAAVLLFLLITVCFLFPLAGIIHGSISGARGLSVFIQLFEKSGFRKALLGTLQTAPFTGVFCCITAFTCAVMLKNTDPQKNNPLLQTLPMMPMAVSPIVMGFGASLIIQQGTPLILIAAQTALTWPLAFRQIYAALNRIPSETIDAARLLSANPLDAVFRVYLPAAKTCIISSFGFCTAVSMGDTSLPLVLSIPNFDTLALYTYRLAGSYRFPQACACGTVLCILCLCIFLPEKKYA